MKRCGHHFRYAIGLCTALGCSSAPEPGARTASAPAKEPAASSRAERADPLSAAWDHFRSSRYDKAEALFRELRGSAADRAALGLAHVLLVTGRYDEAISVAEAVQSAALRREAVWLQGEALRRQGKLEPAERLLAAAAGDPQARRVRLLLGEILLEQGRARDAEPQLMSLVEDYNQGRIGKGDAFLLAMVGRAAQLLESPHDANDAFNEAERAATANTQTLLWRAELFLDNYDQGHAEEVVQEILDRAPNHPEALVWMAQVQLAQSLDFEAAEELASKALEINPKLTRAYFVLAGISLRDMLLREAEQHIRAGLEHNPRDLELLSMRATARFLADDEAGFEAAKQAVLSKNPRYSRLYHIIGEYAEWEHRYEEIVELMREALLMDADDPKVRAQLGFNLIRNAQEEAGLRSLRRAFSVDPFNVRVFNTLNLYEKEIPKHYVQKERGLFVIRYHQDEHAILDRYVPELLNQAFRKMRGAYGFAPKTPVGIELYPEREHFAIRTSGLPHTFIQGVCFGRTLAAMSPRDERFNLGMTLWHELAHVFHIQKSNSRVPRWFTEGLAEYETLDERDEWRREHDLELFEALRGGRLPEIASMNEAFSHARDMADMATAYYASSQIAVFLAETYGRPKLRRMLELWSQSKRTPAVIDEALGMAPTELDARFRKYLNKNLERYSRQFIPKGRSVTLEQAEAAVKRSPADPAALTQYARALLAEEKAKEAKGALDAALRADPKHPDARWLAGEMAVQTEKMERAQALLAGLVADGHDGVTVQMALADVYTARRKPDKAVEALEAAHRFDPTQAVPLRRLARVARKRGDRKAEVDALRKLSRIEQHDGSVYRRLIRLLLDSGRPEEARGVGQSAIYADIEGLSTHMLYAEALAATGALADARFELETAVLCPGRPKQSGEAHARLAEVLVKMGRRAEAKKHAGEARKLDPENDRLRRLQL